MAITEQTPYNSYTGDGSTTVFPYTFKIFAATDIVAYEDGVSTGAVTVSGVGEESGGDVTFSVAPASGVVVLLNREIPYNRLTDYQTSGDLLADTLDADLDRIECQIQQLNQRSVDSIVAIAPGEDYTADGRKITDVAPPEDSGDAANKGYVDGIAADFTMGAIPDGTITEAKLSLSDVTTANVSTSKHGFAPKLPNDASKFLDGTGSYSTLPSASTTDAGVSELADSTEAAAGTDATRTITPSTLRSALNAAGSAPVYACRAWVNFNGTGTVAIRAAGNVSSITDNGTGDYTVNFITAMPDTNYAVIGTVGDNFNNNTAIISVGSRANLWVPTTTSIRFQTMYGVTVYDVSHVNMAIFR